MKQGAGLWFVFIFENWPFHNNIVWKTIYVEAEAAKKLEIMQSSAFDPQETV